jgi:hypothetical protein
MLEFLLLPPKAMEDNGFKLCMARNETLGTAESLEQARRMALNLGGASIFRCRNPYPPTNPEGFPDQPGGHQPFGNILTDPKDLKWLCFVEVLFPGTAATRMVQEELVEDVEDVEEIEEIEDANPDTQRA